MEQNIKKNKSEIYLLIAVVIVIVLQNIPSLKFLLYPFNLLATWIHEMGHGLTAEMMGANFNELVIRADTSGYAEYSYNPSAMGTLAKATISSAGYMGTAIFGALMLFFRRREGFIKVFSVMLGVFMIASLLIYIRSWVGVFFAVPFSLFLIFVGLKSNAEFNKFFYNFLASQIALNSLLNIKVLYGYGNRVSGGQSDASKMSELLIFPYWFWASLWLAISVLLFIIVFFKPLSEKSSNKELKSVNNLEE